MKYTPKQSMRPLLLRGISYLLSLSVALTLAWTGSTAFALEPSLGTPSLSPSKMCVGDKVIPLGRAVGIKLFSDGVLVVGLSSIETPQGPAAPGRTSGLKAGDLITHINQEEVNTIEEVQSLVSQSKDAPLTLQVQRNGKDLQLSTQAVMASSGAYQLGVWLRDSMAGIGTLTFYDPKTGVFAALGHGINDVDTAMLMPLESGSIMNASVSDVKRGEEGSPGELHGVFDLTKDLGTLYANTHQGIFGQMNGSPLNQERAPIPVAPADRIQKGPATILSNIAGHTVQEYAVEIVEVYTRGEEDRNMMLHITDPQLLQQTGGIVQGMSGSPILQNGQLIGAVTHVLVQDPTRGYGISIENMIASAEDAMKT